MTTPIERAIPASGELLPVVGLGTWQTFDVPLDAATRASRGDVLLELARRGRCMVDSSPMYGRAESVVGELMAAHGLRDRLFVATKVWTEGRKAGITQMEESLRRLRVDRVDLMQVHNLVDVDTHLDTLAEWKAAGRVRYVGVTRSRAEFHDAVVRVARANPIDFIQINYSVAERDAERTALPFARERGIAVIVNRPFTEGKLLRQLRGRPVPAWAAEIGCPSWPHLLLKFVISHPAVTCAIPATSSAAHMRANLAAGGEPLPDETLRERIAKAALRA